jgi:C1A family cysteine protease
MKLHLFLVVLLLGLVVGQPPPPKDFDWRDKGVIPPVRNQGQIGDSFVIDGVTVAEAFYAIRTGKLETLSLSEALDCCSSGFYYDIFDCFARIGGLCTEEAYPERRGSCKNNTCTGVKGMKGGKQVTPGNEEDLLMAVLMTPVLVAVDASHTSFQDYSGGVYEDPDCNAKISMLDHTLVVVGYGTSSEGDYWICQNSWGTEWGMNGYIMIARNKGNMCGIASDAYYPV